MRQGYSLGDQLSNRPEPTKVGRAFLVLAGVFFGASAGLILGGRLGPDARVGGVLVYQITGLIGFALLIAGNINRRSRT
jgi:hypothetical protein